MPRRSETPFWLRRSLLAAVALVAAFMLVLAACTNGGDGDGSASAGDINERREAAGLAPLSDDQIAAAALIVGSVR